ncbi:MAG: type II toxin-antitoxin system RelE/ParE family toxin [Deltaproteobacteria bacterium]|nr:type II toxin-antitoxin system RelE/ParE family toxin [Deltaproteobacteria bacterium]
MKKRDVVVSEDAIVDIEEAPAFYDRQERGLGDYFISCLMSDLESLGFFAGIHSVWFGYHRMLAKRFPFAIYYDLVEELVVIMAVLDMRRNPSTIRKRLSDSSRAAPSPAPR